MISDDRFDQVIAPLRSEALAGGSALDSAEHLARMRRVVGQRQQLTNQRGGYWIATAAPSAAYQAVIGSAVLTGPRRLRRAACSPMARPRPSTSTSCLTGGDCSTCSLTTAPMN
ncbi:hypothetical protein KRM28CT15_15150 [Krasilnikovia sp. M28-CT-15]